MHAADIRQAQKYAPEDARQAHFQVPRGGSIPGRLRTDTGNIIIRVISPVINVPDHWEAKGCQIRKAKNEWL